MADHRALAALQRQKAHSAYMVTVGKPTTDLQIGTPTDMTPQYQVTVGEPQIEQQANPTIATTQSNDDAIRARIAAKLTRSPVLGIRDDSLLGMDQLAKVGIGSDPNDRGVAMGLDLSQLNPLEQRWLQRRTR